MVQYVQLTDVSVVDHGKMSNFTTHLYHCSMTGAPIAKTLQSVEDFSASDTLLVNYFENLLLRFDMLISI